MKMNAQWKKKWVDALRSGDFEQGNGLLRRVLPGKTPQYCCLGVLCHVINPSGWGNSHWGGQATNALPVEACKLAELSSANPPVTIKNKTWSLAEHNDAGVTFDEIATAIDEQL